MAKYVFPAIFTPDDDNMYSVKFPDIDGCYTCGEGLADAIYMAEDALEMMIGRYEKTKKPIPSPTDIKNIELKENEFTSYIQCDTLKYKKRHNDKAVKKTLTIPEWLNEEATEAGINFSQALQEILKEKLQIA